LKTESESLPMTDAGSEFHRDNTLDRKEHLDAAWKRLDRTETF